MSTQVVMQREILQADSIQKFRQIQTQLESSIHQHKKSLLQVKSELQFERNRANELQEKYKNAIRFQNEEKQLKKIMNELNEKLRIQENQMLQLLKLEQQKILKISELQSNIEQQRTKNEQLQQRLKQFQEGAVSAIIEKQNIIAELQEKLHLTEVNESTNNSDLSIVIMQLQEKYKQLQERSETTKFELQSIIEQKQQELRQLEERSENHKKKLQQRIARMELQIQDYQKHIEHINEERMHEENLQEKYYITEEKLRKSQKKNSQLQLLINDLKKKSEDFLNKFNTQEDEQKGYIQQIKSLKIKIKQLTIEIKQKEKSSHQLKVQSQKNSNQFKKNLALIQNQKKKAIDTVDIKNMQIERLRVQIEQRILQLAQKNLQANKQSNNPLNDSRVSLASEIKNVNIERKNSNIDTKQATTDKFTSPVKTNKKQNQEQSRLIEKLKNQVSDLESNNAFLSKKLEEKTKELQELRERLVSESGSASRSEQEAKLMCEIEDLSNHIKKLQSSLITEKMKFAEDENFWKTKEKNFKIEIQNLMKHFNKERSQLLQRIDRMKKSGSGKDKKMDYYQSGFK